MATASTQVPYITARELKDSTFAGARYGMPWEKEELDKLSSLFDRGYALHDICVRLQRPPAGVLAKLSGRIRYDTVTNSYYRNDTTISYITTEEQTMIINNDQAKPANAKNIETVTMIRGTDASQLTDDQIFSFIGKLETEAENLSKIQAKPKKLGAKIEAIHADIKALVAYVDGR